MPSYHDGRRGKLTNVKPLPGMGYGHFCHLTFIKSILPLYG